MKVKRKHSGEKAESLLKERKQEIIKIQLETKATERRSQLLQEKIQKLENQISEELG